MANEQHIQWLLEGVEAWNARWKNDEDLHWELADLSSLDFHDLFEDTMDLPRMEPVPLARYFLVGSDLTEANLWKVDLSKANLAVANLKGANLNTSDLRYAELEEADLTGASLWSVNLTGANCGGGNFSDANLEKAVLDGAVFEYANLTNAKLIEAKLRFANFINANLTGIDLNRTRLWEAILYPEIELPNQFNDVPITFSSIGELLDIIRQLKLYYANINSDVLFYFRGEHQDDWELRPSVMRNDGLVESEGKMLLDLISQRPEEFGGRNLGIAQWVLAQHHGLKTRFLDIASNPLVALYHACTNAEDDQIDRKEGRLHIFAMPQWMVKPFNSDTISVITNFAKLLQHEQDALVGNAHPYPSPDYSEAMEKLYQFVQAEKPYFAARIDPRDFYRVFVVEPQQASERIKAQSGAFLVSAFHQRFEREEILKWNERIPVYAHYTLTIPHDCKDAIMEDLRLLNITRETLFPGLDSSAAAITKRYETSAAN